MQGPCREVNGKTARQQADRVEDGCFKYFARSWPSKAFPYVKEIGDDENCEDGRLGNDEAGHADLSPIRKCPGRWCLGKRSRDCAHGCFLTRRDCQGLPDASDPTAAACWRLPEWRRSCTRVGAS